MKHFVYIALGVAMGLMAIWIYEKISGPDYLLSDNKDGGVVIQFRSLGEYPCVIRSLCIIKNGSVLYHEKCSDQQMHWDVSICKTSDGIALNATGSAQGGVQKTVGPVDVMGECGDGMELQVYGSGWMKLSGKTTIEIKL